MSPKDKCYYVTNLTMCVNNSPFSLLRVEIEGNCVPFKGLVIMWIREFQKEPFSVFGAWREATQD